MEKITRQLGRVSQGCRTLCWQEARENYRRALTDLSRAFHLSTEVEQLLKSPIVSFYGGDEHINMCFENEESRIYKITHSDNFGCDVIFDPHDSELTGRNFIARGNGDPYFYCQRWLFLNQISDYQTRIEGFIAPEREGWLPRICISQPYAGGNNPTQTEITISFRDYNFIEVSAGAYYNQHSNILLTDAFPRNVRIVDGHLIPFDAIASTPSEEAKAWLLEKLS